MRLENKTVVVTGASSGMGKAIVELFAKEGANVVAVARRKERLEELAESLKNEVGKVVILAGDVSSRETNEEMIELAVKEFGTLDVLINNAGVMDDMAGIANATDEMYNKVMNINLYGPMCAMRAATNQFLKEGKAGNIINVASIGAMRSAAGPIYGASKAALVAMSKNTAFMYKKDGIRCNVIAPGAIKTEIGVAMGMPNVDGYTRIQPTLSAAPEPGEAIDIANAALFLASNESKYISGDVLVVDGGWIAG